MRKKIVTHLLPPHSRRRKSAKKLASKLKRPVIPENSVSSLSYDQWIERVEPGLFSRSSPRTELKEQPLISIVVPCFNTPEKYIRPLIDSVIDQTYKNWELILADGSLKETSSKLIIRTSKQDKRIEYVPLKKNRGIVGNTNEGLKNANGEFVAFLDHDDLLSAHALEEVVKVINNNPGADLIYSDEDKITDDGKTRLLPFFKPDWSPELLLGVNYITHFVVARKTLVDEIEGLRRGFDGSQDYDFLLRLTEKTSNIVHIPKILYHWRLADGSTAVDPSQKNYADDAGRRALRDVVERRDIKARVLEIPERPTNYRIQYDLPTKAPLVSIIVPFKDKVDYLKRCVTSILDRSTYTNFEVILLSNNSEEQATFDYLAKLKKDKRCKVHEWGHEFNYSAINNFGRKKAKGSYLIFLNNDTEIITPGWIEELVGVASQKSSGVVGPLLRYPDMRIQHAGVVLGMGGMAGHVFRFLVPSDWTHFGMPSWPRNYLAVTGACLAVKSSKFDQVGGFDEKLSIGGNDVALGISLHDKGYRNVYWPFVEIVHYENVSVGPYNTNVPIEDYNRSLDYYRPYLDNGDPYFNPNLDLYDEQISMQGKISNET